MPPAIQGGHRPFTRAHAGDTHDAQQCGLRVDRLPAPTRVTLPNEVVESDLIPFTRAHAGDTLNIHHFVGM